MVHILSINGGVSKPAGFDTTTCSLWGGRFCLANACSLKGGPVYCAESNSEVFDAQTCPCAAAYPAAHLLVRVWSVALSGASAPPQQRLCFRPHVPCRLSAH